jgi:NAD(P)H-nitrite reductase large subunit
MKNNSDFLIIGGSAAGTTAAEVIRGLKSDATITIVTDENHEEYSRVLIPHYIRHKVTREQVFLKKPEWYKEKLIKLLKASKVIKLDPTKHKVYLESGEEIEFGKLLITVGGKVIQFQAPGTDFKNVFYMRTIEDADNIIAGIKGAKNAVVVGGGFIGLELAHSFKVDGVENVTVLVMEPFFWKGKLDEDSAKVLTDVLESNGVKILTNEQVERFEPSSPVILGSETTPESVSDNDSGYIEPYGPRPSDSGPKARMTKRVGKVVTKSGKTIDADIVGIGIGIKSDLGFLEESGVGIERAIVTNEYLETNIPDVYAAGDCAEFKDVIFQRQHILGNWANATSQGSAVGKTMAGEKTVFETASSYSITFFNGSCSFIGVTDESFADEVIVRGSVEAKKMTRIFIKAIDSVMRIVGATVINNPVEVGPLTSAIKGKTDVSGVKDKLSDSNFDLRDIINP